MQEKTRNIEELVSYLYPTEKNLVEQIQNVVQSWRDKMPETVFSRQNDETLNVDERDAILITYAHSLYKDNHKTEPYLTPLQVLNEFSCKYLQERFSAIHLLPFYPYTSDDGFSIVDYRQVDNANGTWQDVQTLSQSFKLMFDFVLNHCSAQSEWFIEYLKDNPLYKDYFISVDPQTDLSQVFRPRALPLLHKFEAQSGEKWVWTTFSRDQVDLNFSNSKVLLDFIDILLFYVSQGAQFIRLDAVGFLWKIIGTNCMHLEQTHAVVQLFRQVLGEIAPQVVIITETNVPHKENISYFGNGQNEAHMVYQFALPPLTLDAFIRGDSRHLQKWAGSLPVRETHNSYFNFLASHDGVGVLAAKDYLTTEQLDQLQRVVIERGGRVSLKDTPTGPVPYELNINYRSAISDPSLSSELQIKQFIASQAVMLSMRGVPGIYIHSLIGSLNWQEGVELSKQNRSINRQTLEITELESELINQSSSRYFVFSFYLKLLNIRRQESLFDPKVSQEIIASDKSLFVIKRFDEKNSLYAIINMTAEKQSFSLTSAGTSAAVDLISEEKCPLDDVELAPFAVRWLKV